MQIVDDGVGISRTLLSQDLQQPGLLCPGGIPSKAGSYGIRGMKERALSVGGSIDFEYGEGFPGTRVILNIPLQREL